MDVATIQLGGFDKNLETIIKKVQEGQNLDYTDRRRELSVALMNKLGSRLEPGQVGLYALNEVVDEIGDSPETCDLHNHFYLVVLKTKEGKTRAVMFDYDIRSMIPLDQELSYPHIRLSFSGSDAYKLNDASNRPQLNVTRERSAADILSDPAVHDYLVTYACYQTDLPEYQHAEVADIGKIEFVAK